MSNVTAVKETLSIPTYPLGSPEKNPLFFEKRVYQGSNGKVYPVPFIDKVYDTPVDKNYQSVRLENDLVRLVMLPEIGGRIFIGQDKQNNNYDFFYRQDVIKPALVGLAGPWISGGVEFNWPQHHRPGTYMPTDVSIEEESDGARTVWFSEHDPIHRLKGMHGIRLRPGSSLIELRARLYNRTPITRTFLWWANVAALVHDQYQSFFPQDVTYVADHAVRATSSFPNAENHYYGVNYQEKPGSNDLTWYKNIPVPTSYMVCQTQFDFFGGYDFLANGGFLHIADRHIAPGKKQWTWGDHAFGHAWDRELTDVNGPYIELMAGVYTDNQPDFTYLHPYETKTFSQFWWPIQGIGPVQNANTLAALRLNVNPDRTLDLAATAPNTILNALVRLTQNDQVLLEQRIDLKPGSPWIHQDQILFSGDSACELHLALYDESGELLIDFRPVDLQDLPPKRDVATEPPAPKDIPSNDELYLTGEHLELYRHPTRNPEDYWNEALGRDANDARCHTALGRRALERGENALAETHLRTAVSTYTHRHPNPVTGEAHYHLALTLRRSGKYAEAYDRFSKAAWNYDWRSAANYQLATLDCLASDWRKALQHLEDSLDNNRNNNKAHTLKARILQKLGKQHEADQVLQNLLAIDPLDHTARYLLTGLDATFAQNSRNDAQTILDLVFDLCEAGWFQDALQIIDWHHANSTADCAVDNPLSRTPMTHYLRAWLIATTQSNPASELSSALETARSQCPDRFFPSRTEEAAILEWALLQDGNDPNAAYALGNFYYDRRRHQDAINVWNLAKEQGGTLAQIYRNLAIAEWNTHQNAKVAREYYVTAQAADPQDARLLCEFDQLRKKLNESPTERLAYLESKRELVMERDDCTVEYISLLNLTGRIQEAYELLTTRRFHPWEGGEGNVLRQYTTSRILLGKKALASGDPATAHQHFLAAMDAPDNLGEAYHLLQAKANVNYWIARSLTELGNLEQARQYFELSASESGDFSEMAVTAHGPLSWYRGLSLRALGREDEAKALFADLFDFATKKLKEKATIDYFATSLPNLLVFDEDLQVRRNAENHLLLALACHGLNQFAEAKAHLVQVQEVTLADQTASELSDLLN